MHDRLYFFPACLVAAFGMAACAGLAMAQTALADSMDLPVTDKAVVAFRDICLATAPSFEKAMSAAKKLGVKPQLDLGSSMVGMAPGNAFSVQVRAKKECAITAESSPGGGVAQQFLIVVAKAAGVSAKSLDASRPIPVTLDGRTYVVRHDRKGGEAYIIVNSRGL